MGGRGSLRGREGGREGGRGKEVREGGKERGRERESQGWRSLRPASATAPRANRRTVAVTLAGAHSGSESAPVAATRTWALKLAVEARRYCSAIPASAPAGLDPLESAIPACAPAAAPSALQRAVAPAHVVGVGVAAPAAPAAAAVPPVLPVVVERIRRPGTRARFPRP